MFSACRSPQIILIPSGSTLINPLKFRRSQWILKNNSNIISFDSQIETTSTELFIPAKKLPFGIFEVELTITLNPNIEGVLLTIEDQRNDSSLTIPFLNHFNRIELINLWFK